MGTRIVRKKSLLCNASEPIAGSSADLDHVPGTTPVDSAGVNDNAPDGGKSSTEAEVPVGGVTQVIPNPADPPQIGHGEPSHEYLVKIFGTPAHSLPGIVDEEPPDESDERGNIELTEDSVARDLVDCLVETARFDHHIAQWFHWDGKRWIADETGRGFDMARRHCRAIRGDNRQLSTRRAIEGVEMMARRDQRISVTSDQWDRDPLLLGTPGGVVDLRTGQLQEANPAHFITKLTRVPPAEKGATCPVFMAFLHAATGGDQGLMRFLQMFGGYSLTGLTLAQVLLFIYGPGGNGKSVLQTVFKEVLGDYAVTSAMETFAASKQQRHLTELAMLRGARMVAVSETEQGQRWAEARINQLTGGDAITANYMRQDHFTFVPEFKLLIIGNHKPQLATVNDAARRRFIIVPFLYKPAEPDRQLMRKLRAEYPAVLRWMIEGCLDWQQNGLMIPDVVNQATSDYFEEQDFPGRWLKERTISSPELQTPAGLLFDDYKEFAISNGENPGTSTSFGSQLAQRGIKKKKSGTWVYIGISLKDAGRRNSKTTCKVWAGWDSWDTFPVSLQKLQHRSEHGNK